jgi:hypothetical protein
MFTNHHACGGGAVLNLGSVGRFVLRGRYPPHTHTYHHPWHAVPSLVTRSACNFQGRRGSNVIARRLTALIVPFTGVQRKSRRKEVWRYGYPPPPPLLPTLLFPVRHVHAEQGDDVKGWTPW